MKDVCLFTKTKITADKVSQKIIDSYKWKINIVQNDSIELFLGFFPYEFYIVYSDSCDINDPDCIFEDSDKNKIPFSNSQVNQIFYRDKKVVKNVVDTILKVFPELYIMDDDGEIFPALQFLNNQ